MYTNIFRFKLRLSDPLHYSFEPSVGILLPKSHVMINVEFSPQEVSNQLNAEVNIFIYKQPFFNHKPSSLFVKLTMVHNLV